MTGTSPDGAGDDLLVSSFITNSSGIAEAWSPIYKATLVRDKKGETCGPGKGYKW